MCEKYESELILHKAAKAHFDKLGLKKLPAIKLLQTKEQRLYQAKNQTYAKYKKARQEMQEILNAKANVDKILGVDTAKKTKEKSQIER